MSIPAVHWALSQRTGSSSRKAVLKCIAEWMIGEKAVDCYPTVEQIAFETELNRKTVMDATRALEKAGFIKKRRACNKKLQWETHYTLVGYEPSEWIGSRRPECRTFENPNVPKPEGTKNGTFEGTKTGTSVSPKTGTYEGTKNGTRTWIDMEDKETTRISMRTSGTSSAIAAVASAQAQTTYPEDFDQSLFEEAMLATQDSEQAPEALPDPDADLPPKKQRRSQQPRVPFPETLPDDWAEAAKIARPDIDPQRVFLKLRARYAPTTTKKTLATWKREFMNWIGKEFAYDNRYRSSAQKPQRTLGATDTRSLNHRNFGKWASHAV